jgi:hypothetical protein
MNVAIKTLPLLLGFAIVGCGPKPQQAAMPPDTQLPDWFLNPPTQNQFVGANCQEFSGNIDIDKQASVAGARFELAQQVDGAVRGLVETFANKTTTNRGMAIGADMSAVSQQRTEQSLKGAVIEKVEMGKINGRTQICTLVTLNPERTKALFKNIMQDTGATLSAQDEDVQFQKFLAAQARDRMDKAFSK